MALCDPSQLGQALPGATALTWQMETASMDPVYSDNVRDGRTASRSAGPADRSVLSPYAYKIAALASVGSAPALQKMSFSKGGNLQVPPSGGVTAPLHGVAGAQVKDPVRPWWILGMAPGRQVTAGGHLHPTARPVLGSSSQPCNGVGTPHKQGQAVWVCHNTKNMVHGA